MSDPVETAFGVLLALVVGVVVAALSLAATITLLRLASPVWLACVGLTQLLIVVPACLIASRKGRVSLMRGLIIGAAIVFLLNAACDGYMFAGMLRTW
jgi:hypothetical protein